MKKISVITKIKTFIKYLYSFGKHTIRTGLIAELNVLDHQKIKTAAEALGCKVVTNSTANLTRVYYEMNIDVPIVCNNAPYNFWRQSATKIEYISKELDLCILGKYNCLCNILKYDTYKQIYYHDVPGIKMTSEVYNIGTEKLYS